MSYGLDYQPLQSPRRVRKAPVGYGSQYGLDYSGTDDPVELGELGFQERNELLQHLSDQAAPAVSSVFGAFDWLGARAREIVTDKPYGSNPSGEAVLDSMGLRPSKDALFGYGRPIAGFVAETALDPLSYTGIGALGGGLTRAGKAAKAANLLDDAARAMSRTKVDDIARGASTVDDLGRLGKRSAKFFQDEWGKDVSRLTDEDLFARPLYGWRESRRNQTLGDLIDRQKDWGNHRHDQAVEDLMTYLSRSQGIDPNDTARLTSALDGLKGQGLASDLSMFGIGVNIPFGGTIARGLDNTLDAARWSGLGVRAYAAFDRSVHGATDAASQVGTKILSRSDDIASTTARREANRIVSLLPKFKDEATDIRMGNAIRNVIEEVGPTLGGDDLVAHDEVLKALTDYRAGTAAGDSAKIGQFIDEWQKLSASYLDRSREAGIGSGKLADKFGHKHFPRVLDDALYEGAGNATAGKTFSVMTGDQLARGKAFHVPGGTQTLRELSLDPNLAKGSGLTDDQAADRILGVMRTKEAALQAAGVLPTRPNGKPVHYTRQQAMSLARKLRKINPDAIKKQLPLFGQHPAENIAKYIMGREKAISRSNVLYDTLASTAKPQVYSGIPGGGFTRPTDALNSLKLRTTDNRGFMGPLAPGVAQIEGAKVQLANRLQQIGAKHGIPEFANIDVDTLNKVAIDQRVLTRLNRIADFYQVPEVQSQFFKTLDAITSLWKASILSWPSRFVRDWYSGMFSNLVEVGNVNDVYAGYSGARYLIEGKATKLDKVLIRMPRYAKYQTAQERAQRYISDLSAQGISVGRQLADVGQSAASRQSSLGIRSQLLASNAPETTPMWQIMDTLSGAKLFGKSVPMSSLPEAELFNLGNWKKSLGGTWQTIKDAASGKKSEEVVNPILRWSARSGDTTDKINRIAGYNGLLLQGISPEQAAKQVMASHIDYQGLTKFEKGWIRNALPFWAYESRIGKWALTKMMERPGGAYTQLGMRLPARLSENDTRSDYVPARIADKYGVSIEPLRDIPVLGQMVNALAPQQEGISSWISDIDLPGIDQINKVKFRQGLRTGDPFMDAVSAVLPTAFATAGQVASGAHPLIKASYETSTGRDAYTGLKKRYARNSLPAVLANTGVLDQSSYQTLENLGYVDQALQFTLPFYSRGMQLARRVTDPKIEDPQARALQAGFNALFGTKIENIDDAEKARDAMEKIKELLDSHWSVRSYDSTYIPKELLPFVDLETQRMYQLDRQLRKERRAMSKVKPEVYNPLNY